MKSLIRRRDPGDPGESGTLNDLSFLLIVFFIVIAGFNVNKGFLVNLPDSSRPRVVQTEDLMRCALSSSGELTLDGTPVSESELRSAIISKKAKWPNMTLLLSIDETAPWQSVVGVIHEVRSLRVENFSFRMAGVTP